MAKTASGSSALTLASNLVAASDLQSDMSGPWSTQPPPEALQDQRARPEVPKGQGKIAVSPAVVQLHWIFRARVGRQNEPSA